ncbi:ATPase, T2SS/T4P/T4SS family, partial [Novispirillum itersonii]
MNALHTIQSQEGGACPAHAGQAPALLHRPGNLRLTPLLAPLSRYYSDPATVEIRMSRPGAVVIDRRGEKKHLIEDPALNRGLLEKMASVLGNRAGVSFDGVKNVKLSCVLPEGHRFELLVGTSVQTDLSLAIRCKHPFTPTWQQLGVSDALRDYLLGKITEGANLIVSGATNTGKTTLLNLMLAEIPDHRRVVACEDTPELHIRRFWDGVGLLAAREEGTGSGMVTWRELYDHMMRITPDNILFGEISTQNAFAALAALNSGVTGFMCTIHAESPEQVIHRKFVQNISWAGGDMADIPEFLADLV